MFRLLLPACFVVLICISARADDANKPSQNVYDVLSNTLAKPVQVTIDNKECTEVATVELGKFIEAIPLFREAWLTHDKSIDFYQQRPRQLLSLIVAKRLAAEMTYAAYEGKHTPQTDCHFLIQVDYRDKFGQSQTINIVTWDFTKELNSKIDWVHIDGSKFNKVADNYKINFDIDDWDADEPPLTDDGKRHPLREQAAPDCDQFLFNANALFIRATTFCRKNYMDSKAGYMALQGSKACVAAMDKKTFESKIKDRLVRLDEIVREKGRRAACAFVEEVAQRVVSGE